MLILTNVHPFANTYYTCANDIASAVHYKVYLVHVFACFRFVVYNISSAFIWFCTTACSRTLIHSLFNNLTSALAIGWEPH